jgi:gluconate 2-dehydrogenase gamma chain
VEGFGAVSEEARKPVNRRALLLGAVVLLGGAAALSRFPRKGADHSRAAGQPLSAEQYALLEQVCESIIPQTDTPGAIVAGVPAFMRDMLANWGSNASRSEITGVLEEIDRHAWEKFGAAFLELPPDRRFQVMRSFDEDRVSRQEPAYGKFKYLVLVGYYQSEAGATQELRYELVPGAWRGCVPYSEIGRATAV